jgi:hypothetical protein
MNIRDCEWRGIARAIRILEQCCRTRRSPLTGEVSYALQAVQHLTAIEHRNKQAKCKTEAKSLGFVQAEIAANAEQEREP